MDAQARKWSRTVRRAHDRFAFYLLFILQFCSFPGSLLSRRGKPDEAEKES